jgi:hypothetical protein
MTMHVKKAKQLESFFRAKANIILLGHLDTYTITVCFFIIREKSTNKHGTGSLGSKIGVDHLKVYIGGDSRRERHQVIRKYCIKMKSRSMR